MIALRHDAALLSFPFISRLPSLVLFCLFPFTDSRTLLKWFLTGFRRVSRPVLRRVELPYRKVEHDRPRCLALHLAVSQPDQGLRRGAHVGHHPNRGHRTGKGKPVIDVQGQFLFTRHGNLQ